MRSPDTNAGPSDRAGFIDAPLTGPPTSEPSATAPPIAIAAPCPTARVSVATETMTSIRKKVSTTSQANAWMSLPAGCVTPSGTSPSVARRSAAAAMAPATCAIQYGAMRATGKCRPTANPSVTAGLKCAPETCPRA